MTTTSDSQKLKVDASSVTDPLLEVGAVRFYLGPRHIASRDVNLLRWDVHMVEQIFVHEPVITVDALHRHRIVFIEIEGHDVGKVQPLVSVHTDEFPVNTQGCRSRGQAKDRVPVFTGPRSNQISDSTRDVPGNRIVIRKHPDGDTFSSRMSRSDHDATPGTGPIELREGRRFLPMDQKQTAARRSNPIPARVAPKMIWPTPNNDEYTETTPAIQLGQLSGPPPIGSPASPNVSATGRQPRPSGPRDRKPLGPRHPPVR